jgi:formamidopyrimidine-DNA glycosylase
MPELPEVETICRSLRQVLPGRSIVAVEVLEPRLRCRVPGAFATDLQGRIFTDIKRKGKYLLISLEPDRVWIVHLGMSGKLIYVKSSRPRERHDHIIAALDNGHELRYHDPRRFGFSLVVHESQIAEVPQLRHLGLEPFDEEFHDRYLWSTSGHSRRTIKDVLADQRVLAGLGNIYANEILFHAGIRPTKRAWKVGRSGMKRIAEAIPRVLQEAILRRGTSFSDYRDGEDRKGGFQDHLLVYGREGEECRVCGSRIKQISIGNRSGFYCPRCQR